MTWYHVILYILTFIAIFRLFDVKYKNMIGQIDVLKKDNEYLITFVAEMNDDVVTFARSISDNKEKKIHDKKVCPICSNKNPQEFNRTNIDGFMSTNYFCDKCSTMFAIPIEK